MVIDVPVLVRAQGRVYTLPDVWIRPPFGGKGRKMTGQLEAHANGFRYSSPKGDTLDIMYRCGLNQEGREVGNKYMLSCQSGLGSYFSSPSNQRR